MVRRKYFLSSQEYIVACTNFILHCVVDQPTFCSITENIEDMSGVIRILYYISLIQPTLWCAPFSPHLSPMCLSCESQDHKILTSWPGLIWQ